MSTEPATLLAARDLTVSYNGVPAVRDVSLEVRAGEVVVVLGSNGAGKTTTVLALAGEIPPSSGHVEFNGEPTTGPLHKRAQQGMALIGDDKSIFMDMSARDNLRVGGCPVDRVAELAPELVDHLDRRTGLLSGGQQQILTVARALARKPTVLLADELSQGIAPLVVDRLYSTVRRAADAGLGVLLVEQQVRRALTVADRVYVLANGRVDFAGTAEEARSAAGRIEAAYLAGDVPAPS